jgi:hypothetical protein
MVSSWQIFPISIYTAGIFRQTKENNHEVFFEFFDGCDARCIVGLHGHDVLPDDERLLLLFSGMLCQRLL